ncbi:hypothetical protein PM082_002194 [Marasmius tenuissimus]|nr:hypothetical protein PM082_002194 [Marasmius tenuissimus]
MESSLIAVMGTTGTGKSTFINAASGGALSVGDNLWSCTETIGVSPPFVLNGRLVTLIDTPGFDDTAKSDTDILKLIGAFLSQTYKAGKQLNGIIYIHRITDVRMGGIAARNFRMFRQLCGEDTLKNVVIVTNRWEEVRQDLGEAREKELMTEERFFKPVLDKGAQMVRHDNTPEMARAILSHLVHNQPIPLRIQVELVDENKEFMQTDAGVELNREIQEVMSKYEQQMEELQKEFEDAVAAKDNAAKEEIEATRMEMEKEMSRLRREAEKASVGLNAHIKLLQKDLETASRVARDQTAELEKQLQDLQGISNVSSSDILMLKQQLEGAQRRVQELQSRPFGGCLVM